MNKSQTRILETLTASPTAMTAREIAKAIGVTAPTALKNAERLLLAERVARGPSRRGAYTFQAGETAAPVEVEKAPEPGRCECQVCEGRFAKDKQGTLWNHGYKRPGWGWLVGGCMGVGHRPFPATNALEAYLAAVQGRRTEVADLLAEKATWPTLSYQVRVDPRDAWNKETRTETIDRPTAETDAAIKAAHDAWEATGDQAWKVQEPLHGAWLELNKAKENWESRYRSQVWRLENETKELALEVERVTARIAKGRTLRASQIG